MPRICVEVAVRLLCIIPDSHGIVLFWICVQEVSSICSHTEKG